MTTSQYLVLMAVTADTRERIKPDSNCGGGWREKEAFTRGDRRDMEIPDVGW